MKKGGNAFDAMVATELALAVAYPYAGILEVAVLWSTESQWRNRNLDYREKAPLAATKTCS
jgi:gamma-glutamyltranspeptidase/glutathione hydrolase